MEGCSTPEELGMKDVEEMYVLLRLEGGKPVILFYSPEKIKISSFKLQLDPMKWNVSVFYPKIPPQTQFSSSVISEIEWKNFEVQN